MIYTMDVVEHDGERLFHLEESTVTVLFNELAACREFEFCKIAVLGTDQRIKQTYNILPTLWDSFVFSGGKNKVGFLAAKDLSVGDSMVIETTDLAQNFSMRNLLERRHDLRLLVSALSSAGDRSSDIEKVSDTKQELIVLRF